MSYNLSDLPADEKLLVELEKQASYLVWKLKQRTATEQDIRQAAMALGDWQRTHFEQCIDKYRQQMGV